MTQNQRRREGEEVKEGKVRAPSTYHNTSGLTHTGPDLDLILGTRLSLPLTRSVLRPKLDSKSQGGPIIQTGEWGRKITPQPQKDEMKKVKEAKVNLSVGHHYHA